MGCDIHLFIEEKVEWVNGASSWQALLDCRLNPGRNYGMFALMAGVRNYYEVEPVAEPRGVPSDISYPTASKYLLTVADEAKQRDADCECQVGTCTIEQAKKWDSPLFKSRWFTDQFTVVDPDAHSGSWLSLPEYLTVLETYAARFPEPMNKLDRSYVALAEYMKVMAGEKPEDVRLVFWFDN